MKKGNEDIHASSLQMNGQTTHLNINKRYSSCDENLDDDTEMMRSVQGQRLALSNADLPYTNTSNIWVDYQDGQPIMTNQTDGLASINDNNYIESRLYENVADNDQAQQISLQQLQ